MTDAQNIMVENGITRNSTTEDSTTEDCTVEPHAQLALDTLTSKFGPARLIWRAFLLDEEAYRYLMRRPARLMHGTVCLLFLLFVVAIARTAGFMLNSLTSIRIEFLQDELYRLVAQTEWYAQNISAVSETTGAVEQLYVLAWQVVRFQIGLPTWGGILVSVLLSVVGYTIAWLVHGIVAHGLARWQGGQGDVGHSLGGLALALSPLIVTTLTLIPGLSLATSLIFLWLLAGQYQALKAAHGLSWPRTLVAAVGPYLLVGLLTISALLFGFSALLPR